MPRNTAAFITLTRRHNTTTPIVTNSQDAGSGMTAMCTGNDSDKVLGSGRCLAKVFLGVAPESTAVVAWMRFMAS